ncbi:ketosteroid isomerase-like protein [Roseimicrobium gellanilyticum]|uniref:Ketosteroid isomerase-like protein n=1 Tax=Roseimicrobium gellanilyticum TaxID=748857 RepID=A0A366HRX0_9BACT|nr:nuclear transport factor 2 family protein [Roseimicrobium gellanilyticum]RBP46246.1 ketosteroid isomerase-like protein [Roseimicrobium gellanilyticum]
MISTEAQNIQLVRDYLAAVESNATGDALARFYTTDALQIELPNRLNPSGGHSDVPNLLKRAEQVPVILQSQEYEIHSIVSQGDRVAVEATWTAVLAVPIASLPAGGTMMAHFAIFFELRDGKIHRQRNYDCFEPW